MCRVQNGYHLPPPAVCPRFRICSGYMPRCIIPLCVLGVNFFTRHYPWTDTLSQEEVLKMYLTFIITRQKCSWQSPLTMQKNEWFGKDKGISCDQSRVHVESSSLLAMRQKLLRVDLLTNRRHNDEPTMNWQHSNDDRGTDWRFLIRVIFSPVYLSDCPLPLAPAPHLHLQLYRKFWSTWRISTRQSAMLFYETGW